MRQVFLASAHLRVTLRFEVVEIVIGLVAVWSRVGSAALGWHLCRLLFCGAALVGRTYEGD